MLSTIWTSKGIKKQKAGEEVCDIHTVSDMAEKNKLEIRRWVGNEAYSE
jgi:hypothetical protein